jgi:hypothetical protein
MSQSNQHYVPQFYFRNFSSDGKNVSALLRESGKVVSRASFRHQCSKRNFYGSQELEEAFSGLEGQHAKAIRMALKIAAEGGSTRITIEDLFRFFQSIMFQRARTALEIQKSTDAKCKMQLAAFRHYISHKEHADREDILRAIDDGKVNVNEKPHANVAESIGIFLPMTIGITDLHLCFLRNQTDYPFLFSDAPVVFYNTWAWHVRNRGVLGVQCPGLQIFYPLSRNVVAMLIDPERYNGVWADEIVLDVNHRADVSQLNALQMHHAMSTVYFSDAADAPYVQDLWSAHRPRLEKLQSIYTDKSDFIVNGQPPEGELMHMFEPQVNHPLSLSFVDCQPISEHQYAYKPRDREIHDELKKHDPVGDALPRT